MVSGFIQRRTIMLDRRRFVMQCGIGATALMSGGCDTITGVFGGAGSHLDATPRTPSKTITQGYHKLDFGAARDGFLLVPSAAGVGPVPLLVMFHGAGASSSEFNQLTGNAESVGFALLVPDSRSAEWDWHSGFGADVAFLDKALKFTFDRVAIDSDRMAVGGFSDGATYALTMGINNGNLFSRIMAFSPAFFKKDHPRGKPRIYIVHGTTDQVIDVTISRDILVPTLRKDGYDVSYSEFPGGHGFLLTEFRRAQDWWL